MSAATVSFVGALVRRNRVLLPVLEEHLIDQEGEVLPHLFMADVERWAEAALRRGQRGDVEQVLEYIELEFSGPDDDVREVISVSFLEHLPRPEAPGAELRDMVGLACAEQLERVG